MGAMATETTLEAAGMCIKAHESSHLFGKHVELFGLENESMNGKEGVARGYVASTGRRAVFILESKKVVGIMPRNLRLKVEGRAATAAANDHPNLCDIQDRLGGVSLQECIMTQRSDVVKVLCGEYNARLDIADWQGISPLSMAMIPGVHMINDTARIVSQYALKLGKLEKKGEKELAQNTCTLCGLKENTPLATCARCGAVQYCSKDCQTKHWKASHKKECNLLVEISKGVIVEKPGPTGQFASSLNWKTRVLREAKGYQKPSHVNIDEKFYIKVQECGPTGPLMIYDRTREFEFCLNPGQSGFEELRRAVLAEKKAMGRKTYMQASFNGGGVCIAFPSTATIKTW
jgi:MYND finger